MAPRAAPRNSCPGRPALHCPALFVITEKQTPLLLLYIRFSHVVPKVAISHTRI